MSFSLLVVVCAFVLGLAVGALLHALVRRYRMQEITAEFEQLQQRLLEERETKREPKGSWRTGPSSPTDRGYDA